MKKFTIFTVLLTAVCLCLSVTYAKDAMVRDIRKGGADNRGEDITLDINISFSANAGETITDENGTTYCFYGYRSWEEKIYPPEYWGVFPLYFFGQRVGINVTVKNEGNDDVKLRVVTECYCLNTDGGNGAQLLAPQEQEILIAGNQTESLDGSFVASYVEGADSGLDRFLVKVYEAGYVTYQVVQDDPNTIKYEDAAPGLGEDGAKQKDTFVIGVEDAQETIVDEPSDGPPMPPVTLPMTVLVKTKAGQGRCTTALTGQGASAMDDLGFLLKLEYTGANYAVLSVESVDNPHALSHVEFEFIEGAEVFAPEEGPCTIPRETLQGEDSTLIMVKEGVFCPPELDEEMIETLDAILGN